MTTMQEIKNQHTSRERQRETHSRIAQIVYDTAEIERIHKGASVRVSPKVATALQSALEILESIKAGEE